METSTEVKPNLFIRMLNNIKFNLWKFIGALIMEEKNGVQAVSLNKFLGICTYMACLYLWLTRGVVTPEIQGILTEAKVDVPSALVSAGEAPQSMLYTLWGLLAINGGAKIAGIIKKPNESITE